MKSCAKHECLECLAYKRALGKKSFNLSFTCIQAFGERVDHAALLEIVAELLLLRVNRLQRPSRTPTCHAVTPTGAAMVCV